MTRNESNIDRILRVLLGLAIFAAGIVTGSWLGLIGIIPFATGLIGWCPIYAIFGLSTCRTKTPAA